MRRGRRQKLKSGDEVDVIGRWRKWLSYLKRAGVAKRIKRDLNRRARRDVKRELRDD
jgi:hypothetical protein